MRREDVRHAMQQCREVPSHAGVPGVRMHHAGTGGGIGHPKIGRQRRQCGVGVLERGVGLMGERPGADRTHAVHVDFAQVA